MTLDRDLAIWLKSLPRKGELLVPSLSALELSSPHFAHSEKSHGSGAPVYLRTGAPAKSLATLSLLNGHYWVNVKIVNFVIYYFVLDPDYFGATDFVEIVDFLVYFDFVKNTDLKSL